MSQDQNNIVTANFNNLVDSVEVKFNFRKFKEESTGLVAQRAAVILNLPLLSVEGIAAVFNAGGKQLDLLVESVRDVQIARARDVLGETDSLTAENFPLDQISWNIIANLPVASRRGAGISKETWEEFAKDYIAVMPAATGKTTEQVSNACKILLNRFQAVKTNKPVLRLLQNQISIYTNSSPLAESFSDCITFLSEKAETFLNLSDADLVSNL